MKKKIALSIGELAYLADVIESRHPADFWTIQSRVNLADKLRKAYK